MSLVVVLYYAGGAWEVFWNLIRKLGLAVTQLEPGVALISTLDDLAGVQSLAIVDAQINILSWRNLSSSCWR
jgi:hypothetical protein